MSDLSRSLKHSRNSLIQVAHKFEQGVVQQVLHLEALCLEGKVSLQQILLKQADSSAADSSEATVCLSSVMTCKSALDDCKVCMQKRNSLCGEFCNSYSGL